MTDLTVFRLCLDSMILKFFSKLNYSMILSYEKQEKLLLSLWRRGTEFIWGSTMLSGLPKVFFSSCFSNPSTPRPNHTETTTGIWGGANSHQSVQYSVKLKKVWFSCFKRGSQTELELLFKVFVDLVTCRKAQRTSIVRKIFRPEIT